MIGASPKKADEDQDDTMADYLDWTLGSTVKQFAQSIPGAGPLAVGLAQKAFGKGQQADTGFIFQDALNTIATENAQNVRKAESGKMSAQHTTRSVLTSLALLGVPLAADIARPASYLAGLANDEYQPDDALAFVRGLVSGTPGPKGPHSDHQR